MKETATLASSYGTVDFDPETGEVLDVFLDPEFGSPPSRVDVEEWKTRYPGEDIGPRSHDVLDFGYWNEDCVYETPSEEWRTYREE